MSTLVDGVVIMARLALSFAVLVQMVRAAGGPIEGGWLLWWSVLVALGSDPLAARWNHTH